MTYGIYSRDLKSFSLTGKDSIAVCKKYIWKDSDVICSERRKWCAWVVKLIFHNWHGFHYYRYDCQIVLGFVSIMMYSKYYTGADKIVYDPQATGGETK